MTAWNDLCARYPTLKCVDHAECGEGWYQIIEGTFIALLMSGFTGEVLKVGETLGGLHIRLQYEPGTPEDVIQDCQSHCAIAYRASLRIEQPS